MENEENHIEAVRRLILENKHPSYQTTDRREIRVICPYCDDGKHKDAGKFYIAMKPPFMFHCKRCETSGVLSNQVLRDLQIYDTNAAESLILANKEYRVNQGVQHISYKKRNLLNTPVESEASERALRYFNSRYGSSYSIQELAEKFKCITDPLAFFVANHIYYGKDFDYSSAIGFISSDATHLIFRDIGGQQPRRYTNLNIEKEYSFASKAYNIAGDIDIMAPKITLVITEGIFDIIGVYTHFYRGTPEERNTIFAAACGKSYNAVILRYLRMGFLDLDIEIYSDADVNLDFYKNLKASSPFLKNTQITVYYNALYNPATKYGKDFGVKKQDIKLRKTII